MVHAIYNYFLTQNKNDAMIQSTSSLDDMKISEAVPIIKKTWTLLMKNKKAVGAKIYDNILTKEITMSQLFMKTNLDQQEDLFMTMMNTVVGFLDEPETMDDKLAKLGAQHVVDYKIKTKHFKHFKSAFMKAIKRYLPWTDRRENAWLWFWNKIIHGMSAATQANHFPLGASNKYKHLQTNEIIQYAHNIHLTFDTALQSKPGQFAKSFYSSLCESQPDVAKLFSNTSFDEQAAKFISMLKHAISLLDDTETFATKLGDLAVVHVEYGVKINQLEAFGKILVRHVKELNIELYNEQQEDDDNNKNGSTFLLTIPKWNETFDKSWEWFWTIVINLFSDGMNKQINKLKNKKLNANLNKKQLQDEDFGAMDLDPK